jgi:uncharacterized protein (DUF697 family)
MAVTNPNASSTTAQANQIVWNYALLGVAPAIVLIPWVDVVLLSGIQLKMLHSLARLFGVEFSSQLGKAAIASLVGASVPTGLASYVIPVVGRLIGGASMAVLGATSTYAVGKVFIQHFDSGGTLLTFDPDKVREYYAHHVGTGLTQITESYVGVNP